MLAKVLQPNSPPNYILSHMQSFSMLRFKKQTKPLCVAGSKLGASEGSQKPFEQKLGNKVQKGSRGHG